VGERQARAGAQTRCSRPHRTRPPFLPSTHIQATVAPGGIPGTKVTVEGGAHCHKCKRARSHAIYCWNPVLFYKTRSRLCIRTRVRPAPAAAMMHCFTSEWGYTTDDELLQWQQQHQDAGTIEFMYAVASVAAAHSSLALFHVHWRRLLLDRSARARARHHMHIRRRLQHHDAATRLRARQGACLRSGRHLPPRSCKYILAVGRRHQRRLLRKQSNAHAVRQLQ